jgi:hypothetical protein
LGKFGKQNHQSVIDHKTEDPDDAELEELQK